MILLPAIDMKDGCAVRLKKGDFNQTTVYSDDPVEFAVKFREAGAGFIHLVDLDGALKGHSVNEEAIKKITSTVDIPCELGGGIRSLDAVEYVLGLGVYRVILGTSAVQTPDFVSAAVDRFGSEHIVVGIDAKNGKVATHGWESLSDLTVTELALDMKNRGVQTVIYTDISRDGMLTGPNVEATKELSDKTGLDIIASGGVSCIEDLEKISKAGIYGAIIGKAYYEGRLDLAEAVRRFS